MWTYVAAFFAAIHAGNIAVPLFAPTLSGHAERLTAVLADARPTVVLTTTAAAESVREFLRTHPVAGRPRVIAVDAIPATLASMFTEPIVDTDDVAYLQYTSGLDTHPGRGGDHPSCRLHQRGADGPGRRAGPESAA